MQDAGRGQASDSGGDARSEHLIWVLEDDPDVAATMCDALRPFGYETERFSRGHEMLRRVATARPALCIVDLGLPDLDGLDVLKALQEMGVAAVVVTGRGDVSDRVLGLELGADDYIVKPFAPRELVARIAAVLRRVQAAASPGSRSLARFGDWTFDVDGHCVTSAAGTTVRLSRAETRLLEVLARAANRVLTREFILDTLGAGPTIDRTIDVRVSRLRQKLERDPQRPQLIRTVYGTGYLFASRVLWSRGR
jgi:DNA-binding response OmpR family regulator